ncbi:MAG: anthranilate phosphoribosyltransferase [Planctomycetes bacterium]|nr:anthranilate phosphoribosyltransferase [Planctomycetota bacterium]
MKDVLEQLIQGRHLAETTVRHVISECVEGRHTPAQMSAFLTAMRMKGESAGELTELARTLRDMAVRPNIPRRPLIDTAGTGGDSSGSFNISTLTALLLASLGLPVAKHGGRAVSGRVGSADLLESLGIRITLTPEEVETSLDHANFAFLFAPAFHPATKVFSPIRKELGIRTIFNLLGPLTNPARPEYQLLGVYPPGAGPLMAEALRALGVQRATIVRGGNGWDEATLGEPVSLIDVSPERITSRELDPRELGFTPAPADTLRVSSREDALRLARAVLDGADGPAADTVLLNTVLALQTRDPSLSPAQARTTAEEALRKGALRDTVSKLRHLFPVESCSKTS